MTTHERHLAEAIRLARENVEHRHGRPFGAVLVHQGRVVATGVNTVRETNDPTAHAELEAIRAAARATGAARFDGHVMYASGHPCPMCLAAMYMVGIREASYAYSLEDGEPYGLSTADVYAELAHPPGSGTMRLQYLPVRPPGEDLYEEWRRLDEAPGRR